MAAVMAGGQAAAAGPPSQQQPGGGGGVTPAAGPPQKTEMSTMLQQLNLESIRTRSHDLFTAISSILQSFQTIPHLKWSEVLRQFSMVNVELLNLVEDIKPILKMFVVHPKNVNAENSPILPVMLSSKLLPEMEAEEAALKEQILASGSSLPLQLQTEKLQKQIGMVIKACECAEKALTENRKLYGLGSRQVPGVIPQLDKAQAAKIADQEKLLRHAVNMGEGLRLLPSERQQPVSLPQHLVIALQSADGGSTYPNTGTAKGLSQPSSMGALAGSSQQIAAAQILNRSVPSSSMPIIGNQTLEGGAAPPMFTNSPRSANTMIADPSPQQQQQSLLQRQKVQQQLQKQQQLQQQQLRQPVAPQLGQQVHYQQQLQHQAQLQLQAQRMHQQQQQLQSISLQPGQQLQQSLGQNHLAPAQIKPHLGSNTAGSLFGNTQVSSNMIANLGTNIPPTAALLQQRMHLQGVGMGAAGQPQRSLPSQLLTDPMYNIGIAGAQNTANLGLPLQQQLVGQSNFNSIMNPNQTLSFTQQRQQQPPTQ